MREAKQRKRLANAPAATPPPPSEFVAPRVLRYRQVASPGEWQVDRFDGLAAAFALPVDSLEADRRQAAEWHRLQAGIPLEDPLMKGGRKRVVAP